MSSQELSRVGVTGRVKAGNLRLGEASELLELSYRQDSSGASRIVSGGNAKRTSGELVQ